jgi:hypothetical protein
LSPRGPRDGDLAQTASVKQRDRHNSALAFSEHFGRINLGFRHGMAPRLRGDFRRKQAINDPAAGAVIGVRGPAVAEDMLVRAAGVHQRIGQYRQAVEVPTFADRSSQILHVRSSPRSFKINGVVRIVGDISNGRFVMAGDVLPTQVERQSRPAGYEHDNDVIASLRENIMVHRPLGQPTADFVQLFQQGVAAWQGAIEVDRSSHVIHGEQHHIDRPRRGGFLDLLQLIAPACGQHCFSVAAARRDECFPVAAALNQAAAPAADPGPAQLPEPRNVHGQRPLARSDAPMIA